MCLYLKLMLTFSPNLWVNGIMQTKPTSFVIQRANRRHSEWTQFLLSLLAAWRLWQTWGPWGLKDSTWNSLHRFAAGAGFPSRDLPGSFSSHFQPTTSKSIQLFHRTSPNHPSLKLLFFFYPSILLNIQSLHALLRYLLPCMSALSQADSVSIFVLPESHLTCVTLGWLLTLSGPQFLHFKNGDH